ncbi:calcium-dependent lipid-binding protein-like [Wolffia australiana]
MAVFRDLGSMDSSSSIACPCGSADFFNWRPRGLGLKLNRRVSPGRTNPRLEIKAGKMIVERNVSRELNYAELPQRIAGFEEDFAVEKLRAQVAAIQPIPALPANQNVAGLVASFFVLGVFFDRIWTRWRGPVDSGPRPSPRSDFWAQVPTSFSLFLQKNLQRKESVEWVNMVLGKLWKVYPAGLENWVIGLLQPVIDDLEKPDYVQRVEIKQFSMGDEPLSVRNVERRTSRRANDLQYQIGLRYTGGARMLLSLSLKFGIIPIVVPIGIRNFDIDGELWVKLRLIPSEPWIGAVSWAFVSLPKIKFELSPFRLFNLMAIPVLSMFLTKLLTEDLPQLFVRPKKIVIDFQKGEAHGPVTVDGKSHVIHEGNKDFLGELSVTLVDARNVPYVSFAKTDPYVVLNLGDQEIRSKRNSQTTVIGPPGKPIWNQDFHLLVSDPRKEKLHIQVRDSFGFSDFTVGAGEVELGSLQDTVPSDRVIALERGWGLLGKGSSGEILLRLTYKAYVEDEEDDPYKMNLTDIDPSDDDDDEDDGVDDDSVIGPDFSDAYPNQGRVGSSSLGRGQEPLMDLVTALLMSQEFQNMAASQEGNSNFPGNYPLTRPISGTISNPKKTVLLSAVITGMVALISMKLCGSGIFNS